MVLMLVLGPKLKLVLGPKLKSFWAKIALEQSLSASIALTC